jgi:DNA-directed RNA polymerase specialized sigma24 family protein
MAEHSDYDAGANTDSVAFVRETALRLARERGLSSDDAEDCASHAMLEIFTGPRQATRESRNLVSRSAWLRTCIRNSVTS